MENLSIKESDEPPVREQRRRGLLWAVQDVARLCGCSVSKVEHRVRAGMLPVQVMIGQRWYWQPHQLAAVKAGVESPLPARRRKLRLTKLTEEQVAEMRRLRSYGMGQMTLAKWFRVSQPQVSRTLRRGQPVTPHARRDPERVRRVVELRAAGLSLRAVGEAVGMSHTVVRRILREQTGADTFLASASAHLT